MAEGQAQKRACIVSFSGIDGAGKSTQIHALHSRLTAMGLETRVLAFWEHVGLLTHVREVVGHALFRGDKGVGIPSKPIMRRDKNLRTWPMMLIRLFLYFVDAISACIVFRGAQRSGADVVILDRWIYDELANLDLEQRLSRIYARIIAKLVPRPAISFVLDAEPHDARARKPEYPVEFLVINRASYLHLSQLIGGLTVLPAGSLRDTETAIAERVLVHISPKTECGRVMAMGVQA